ncbi:hypothetical protein [Sinomonas gamaensis]|uniref:hypothetical protein n=1 Tax=Sinomonas gamaensis TaxID=2565624 RepID=UPI001109497C|nr:hypothetical protein [Sinomonas gamaensis]
MTKPYTPEVMDDEGDGLAEPLAAVVVRWSEATPLPQPAKSRQAAAISKMTAALARFMTMPRRLSIYQVVGHAAKILSPAR